jgi:hypothetical protein
MIDIKINSLTLDYIFYCSIILFSLLARIINISQLFLAFIGAYFFLIVPYVVGKSILKINLEKKIIEIFGNISKYYIEWIFGLCFLTVLSAILEFFSLRIIIDHIYMIPFISIFFNIITDFLIDNHIAKTEISCPHLSKYLFISIFLGIGQVAIIKIFFLPIPYTGFNFDIPYTTNLATVRMIEDGFVSLLWRWLEFTNAAIISKLLNLDTLYFISVASFSLIIIYCSGVFLISNKLFENTKLALLSVLFSIFLNTGSLGASIFIDKAAYVYRSNTIVSSIFPFALYVLYSIYEKNIVNKKRNFLLSFWLFIVTLLFFIFYNTSWIRVEYLGLPQGWLGFYLFPIATFLIFIITLLILYLFTRRDTIFTLSIITIILLTAFLSHGLEAVLFGGFLFFFSITKIINDMNYIKNISLLVSYTTFLFIILQLTGMITKSLNLYDLIFYLRANPINSVTGFDLKWETFFDVTHPYNAIIISIILSASVIFLLIEKNKKFITILALTWIGLFIFFIPELYVYRMYSVLTPLMALTFTYVLFKISQKISYLITEKNRKIKNNKPINETELRMNLHVGSLIILFLLISPTLFIPFYSRYSFTPEGSTFNSYFTDYDYQVAKWIKENTSKNTIIISDYFSMKTYQGLSSRINTYSGLNAGEESIDAQSDLTFLKYAIFHANTSINAYESTFSFVQRQLKHISWQESYALKHLGISIDNSTVLIVINPRTSRWIEQRGILDVREPYGEVYPIHLTNFKDRRYFYPIFQIENKVYVFKLISSVTYEAENYGEIGKNYESSQVLHLSFNNIENKVAFDLSGLSNNGIANNIQYLNEKFGIAAYFNGKDSLIEISDSKSLNFDEGISIEAWIKPSGEMKNEYQILGKNNEFMLRIERPDQGSGLSFFVWINGVPEPRVGGVVIEVNKWYHVVETYDGVFLKIYINGTLMNQCSRVGKIDKTKNPITIGNIYGHPFEGYINDIKLYNYALSQEQIVQHYMGKFKEDSRMANIEVDKPGYILSVPINIKNSYIGINLLSKIDNVSTNIKILKIELWKDNYIVALKEISTNRFVEAYSYSNIYEKLDTSNLKFNGNYLLKIYWEGTINIWIDKFILFYYD